VRGWVRPPGEVLDAAGVRATQAQPGLLDGVIGMLGRLATPLLRDAGAKVRVLSRRSHESGDGVKFVTGDLATGEVATRLVELALAKEDFLAEQLR
jgi:nucleoside-diphosphate-sugar epimerase